MGLDMFLFKIKKSTVEDLKVKDIKEISIFENGTFLEDLDNKIYENCEEVAYWRKANAIHNFFVDTVQNGEDNCNKYSLVTKEVLQELLEKCEEVECFEGQAYSYDEECYSIGQEKPKIENKEIIEKISNILPTQEGFFFGSTQYDDWYFEEIKKTIEICKNLIKNFDFENCYLYYNSSW